MWLASIVEFSDDAIISKNLDGIMTSWNKGAEQLFGYWAEEAIGKPVTILIPLERQHEEGAILDRIRCGDRIEHYETVRQRKDGGLIDVSLTISLLGVRRVWSLAHQRLLVISLTASGARPKLLFFLAKQNIELKTFWRM
jgi:PAS domain S-box-containing protein